MKRNLRNKITNHALQSSNEEVCGFVVCDKFGVVDCIPVKNSYEHPSEGFFIHAKDFLDAKKKYEVLAVYHSHPDVGPEPSRMDIITSECANLPFYIYSLLEDSFFLYIPKGFQKELMGRNFVEDIFNCATFVKNYFEQNLGIEWKYDGNFFELDKTPKANANILNAIIRSGFKEVDKEDIQKHDLMIFKGYDDDKFFHLGVYIGDGEFVHHEENKLSCTELYDEKYQRLVYKLFRYKEQNG